MASLYELKDEYRELFAELAEAETDEQAAEIWGRIETVAGSIEEKADAYAKVMRNMMADAEAYKAEKLRLAQKQKSAEAAVVWLKDRIADTMQEVGASEIKTSIGRWYFQKNPQKVVVTDKDAIPEQWMIPQEPKVDLFGMLQYMKETGEVIPGAEMVQETGIRFR